MIFNDSEMVSNIKRRFSDEDFSSGFYLLWFVFTLAVFGFFGVIPTFSKLNEKISIVHEMQNLNNDLSNKMSTVKSISSDLEEAQKYTPYLDIYLPTEFDTQSYLVDAVLAVAKSGYDLVSFTPILSESGSLELSMELVGPGDPVTALKNLEDLKRITQINEAEYDYSEEEGKVNINLTIYSMEGYR